jgi:hypothetical protein
MLLEKNVRRSLVTDPSGPLLTTVEAACLLDTTPAKIGELVLDGTLRGRIEDQRCVGVSRASVRRFLGL